MDFNEAMAVAAKAEEDGDDVLLLYLHSLSYGCGLDPQHEPRKVAKRDLRRLVRWHRVSLGLVPDGEPADRPMLSNSRNTSRSNSKNHI